MLDLVILTLSATNSCMESLYFVVTNVFSKAVSSLNLFCPLRMASVEQKLDALSAKVDALTALLKKLAVAGLSGAGAGVEESKEDDGSSHPSIVAYDELVNGSVSNLFKACAAIEPLKNMVSIFSFAKLHRSLLKFCFDLEFVAN